MALALDHFARHLRDAHLATLLAFADETEADLGRLFAARIDQHQVGNMDGGLLLADPARLAHAARLDVPRRHRHALHDRTVRLRHDAQHLAAAALVDAGDHHDCVTLADTR